MVNDKMINYTENEIRKLLYGIPIFLIERRGDNSLFSEVLEKDDCVEKFVNCHKIIEKESYYVYIAIKRWSSFLDVEILMKILMDPGFKKAPFNSLTKHISKDRYEALFDMITEVPFGEVPLYINDFTEIASWRLKIGK